MSISRIVEQFLDFIRDVKSDAVVPKYTQPDCSRFQNSTNTFDALVELPWDRKPPEKRTVVIYTCVADAEWYENLLKKVKHPSILEPIHIDRRGGVKIENICCDASDTIMVAHVYEFFPERFDTWVERRVNKLDLWERDEYDEKLILGVSETFRELYKNIVSPFRALNDAGCYHGKGFQGIYIMDDLQVKLANFRMIRVDKAEDVTNGTIHDLKTIERVMFTIISRSGVDGLELPTSVRLYFQVFEFFQPLLKPHQLRLLKQLIYMPPLMYNQKQRSNAITMAWQFSNFFSYRNWKYIISSVQDPDFCTPLFDKNWREAISKLGAVNDPLRKELVEIILKYDLEKNLRNSYCHEIGIIEFHRDFLMNYDKLFGPDSHEYEADDVLTTSWPDAVPTIFFGLLCISLGRHLKTVPCLPKELDMLQLMLDNSLTFGKLQKCG